jgi:hypothetical protein
MATQTERTVVYAAGVVQGIALVTFPAASTILTDPSEYDLTLGPGESHTAVWGLSPTVEAGE